MNKLLIICGPTAAGKTFLGIRLAKRFNGELISADSRQVYRGMNIITGKDLPVNPKFEILNPKQITNHKSQITSYRIGYYKINGIKIWLYDVVGPDYQFNVADYVRCTDIAIKDILRRNKLPILVGGTGFYIQAVIKGIESMGIPPNFQLRKKLEKKSVKELFFELETLDPFRAAKMNMPDRKNPRRLVRALEIAHWRLENLAQKPWPDSEKTDSFFVGLKAPYKVLYRRIDSRIDKQLKQGAEKEVKNLLKKGYRWDNSALGATIGYREWRDFFERKATREEVIQRWKFAEHAYARRQMAWFRKALSERSESKGKWFDITDKKWQDKVEQLVSNWNGAKN